MYLMAIKPIKKKVSNKTDSIFTYTLCNLAGFKLLGNHIQEIPNRIKQNLVHPKSIIYITVDN